MRQICVHLILCLIPLCVALGLKEQVESLKARTDELSEKLEDTEENVKFLLDCKIVISAIDK